jgi:1-acyl-sn-glycerol-3-phosphate acyltransferase
MVLVRSLIYLLVMVLSVAAYTIPIGLGGWAMSDRLIAALGAQWARINLTALRMICGLSVRVRGLENLAGRNTIVLSKHQSTWETIAFLSILPRPQTWVVKKELLRVPLFGWSLAQFKPIAIDRSAGRTALRELLEQGRRAIEGGRWVIIFPEGTRMAAGKAGRYGLGGAMLAERIGRPVIPIAHNAGVFWGRRDVRKFPGIIDVVIGSPIETSGLRATEINTAVEAWIEETVTQLPGVAS